MAKMDKRGINFKTVRFNTIPLAPRISAVHSGSRRVSSSPVHCPVIYDRSFVIISDKDEYYYYYLVLFDVDSRRTNRTSGSIHFIAAGEFVID